MIKVIIIDDERSAIRELEFFLGEYSDIEVVGTYINPMKALDDIMHKKPQLVFLDIHMPQLSGLDLVSKMLDLCPDLEIVFVTAYDHHALEAYELNAIDYVLKPIKKERFEKTVQRLMKRIRVEKTHGNKQLIIKTFGGFKVCWEGEEPIKWRTEKTKELFAFLLTNAGNEISKDKLLDTIWRDIEPEKSTKQLHNAIYYIRKTLEEYGISREQVGIIGSYCLKINGVNYDRVCWQRLKMLKQESLSMEEIEAVYTGDYLEDVDWFWADLDRNNYVNEYINLLQHCAKGLMIDESFYAAEECLLKAFHKNPYEDKTTVQLIKLYGATSQKTKAIKHYENYTRLLREELHITPSDEITVLLNMIK